MASDLVSRLRSGYTPNGSTWEGMCREAADTIERYEALLDEMIYGVRNAAGLSEWAKQNSGGNFDYDRFRIFVEHLGRLPAFVEIAEGHDADLRRRGS